MDIYQHLHDADTFVIGWTFADRFHMRYENANIDILPQANWLPHLDHEHAGMIEHDYKNFHRYFYALYDTDFMTTLSDMLVISCYHLLKAHGKKIAFFSWEKREIEEKILLYPYISPQHRLPCGHLNQQGTEYLWMLITNILKNEQI